VIECGVLQRKVELLESQLKQLRNENNTLQNSISENVSSNSPPSNHTFPCSNGNIAKRFNAFSRTILFTEQPQVMWLYS